MQGYYVLLKSGLFLHNLLGSFKGDVDVAADVLLAYGIIESCFLKSCMDTWIDSGENNLDALLLAHLAKVGEVVDSGGVYKRYLSHSYDAYLGTVAEGCHNLFETVAGTEEVRTVDFVYLHAFGDGEMLKITLYHVALLVYLIHDDLNVGSLRHTLHEQQTGDDKSYFDGYGKVEDDGQEEGDEQNGNVALRILHQSEERTPA